MVVLVNYPKKSLFQAKGEFGLNLAKNRLTLYLMMFHTVFFKYFGTMGNDRLKKVALVSFPQKSSFSTIVQFSKLFNLKSQTVISHDSLSKNPET